MGLIFHATVGRDKQKAPPGALWPSHFLSIGRVR
jgi:hypothetical protein